MTGKEMMFKRLRRALFSKYSGIQFGVTQTTNAMYFIMQYSRSEMPSVSSIEASPDVET